MTCPICGDELALWAAGRYALQLTIGGNAPDDQRRVFRCVGCGYVSVHLWEKPRP